jgi:D-3-phosphoglycerate dehydrogenase
MTLQRVFVSEPMDVSGETYELLRAGGVEVKIGREAWDRPGEAMSEAELIEACADCQAVMGASRDRFGRGLFEACPDLLMVSKYGIGTERIEVDAATELGVIVANTPVPENYHSVAEHTIALTLALQRRLKELEPHVRAGGWRGPDTILTSMEGQTFGLVGFGRIGRSVATRLAGWGARLIAYDPYLDPAAAAEQGVELVGLDQLLGEADVVALTTVVTDETRGMIDERALALMKPEAVLVNTSRGALIDGVALTKALEEGRLKGAGLDVTDPEPPAVDDPLQSMPNVIISPHTAGWTARTIAAISRCGAENVLEVAAGRPPLFAKNPAVLGGPNRAGIKDSA